MLRLQHSMPLLMTSILPAIAAHKGALQRPNPSCVLLGITHFQMRLQHRMQLLNGNAPLPVRAAKRACPFTEAGIARNSCRPTAVGMRSACTTLRASKPIFSWMRSRHRLHAWGCPRAVYGFRRSESSLFGPCTLAHIFCEPAPHHQGGMSERVCCIMLISLMVSVYKPCACLGTVSQRPSGRMLGLGIGI